MNKPVITKNIVKTVYENRFLKAYDLQYEEGRHYYVASRRSLDELTAIKNDEELKNMVPDAVSCVVILNIKGKEPLLCLTREYRFPVGHFLLSVPAGLIDKEDKENENPAFATAKREIEEEIGVKLENSDKLTLISPLLFSTPGMTDESNAVVQVVINRDCMPNLSQEGAVGGECFDGFVMLTKDEAIKVLRNSADSDGIYYSTYTWIALTAFVSEMWK